MGVSGGVEGKGGGGQSVCARVPARVTERVFDHTLTPARARARACAWPLIARSRFPHCHSARESKRKVPSATEWPMDCH